MYSVVWIGSKCYIELFVLLVTGIKLYLNCWLVHLVKWTVWFSWVEADIIELV